MSLTPEQIAEARKKYGVPEGGYGTPNSRIVDEMRTAWGIEAPSPEGTPEEEDMGAFETFGKGVVESLKKRSQKQTDIQKEGEAGRISPLSEFLQTGGQGAGMLGDIMFEALKLITPKSVEDVAGGAMEKII